MSDETVPRVGARELRHGLSGILDRVWAGESFEITDRGRPVARLVPPPGRGNALERLVADGVVRGAERPLHPLPRPLRRRPGATGISAALEEQRGERLP